MASIDRLDFAIYRFLSPDGAARFWGGRRVIDPRVGAREIAGRVGASETAVRSRLRALRESGYLADSAVWPNPSLFGTRLYVAEIPIAEVGASRALFDDLGLVEGVTFARDVLDERDRSVHVYFVGDSAAIVARRADLLRRFAPRSELRGPRPYFVPPAARELTPLDWKVVDAVRRTPDASLQDLSGALRVSLKTAGLRFRALLDAGAIWWTHGPASAELPLALLTAAVAEGVDPDPIATQVATDGSDWIPIAANGRGREPDAPRNDFAGLQWTDSPAAVEAAAQRMLDRPGIRAVRRTFALGSRIYPEWFDAQLGRKLRDVA